MFLCDSDAMATVADFRARDFSGAFSALSDPQVQILLDDAALTVTSTTWGAVFTRAHVLQAMHLGALSQSAGAGANGPVTSASADGVSTSWAASTADASWQASTLYGRELLALAAAFGIAGPSVIVGDPLTCTDYPDIVSG